MDDIVANTSKSVLDFYPVPELKLPVSFLHENLHNKLTNSYFIRLEMNYVKSMDLRSHHYSLLLLWSDIQSEII